MKTGIIIFASYIILSSIDAVSSSIRATESNLNKSFFDSIYYYYALYVSMFFVSLWPIIEVVEIICISNNNKLRVLFRFFGLISIMLLIYLIVKAEPIIPLI